MRTSASVKIFCPNFFNTFHDQLLRGQLYNHLMGNRSTVLHELGRFAEAEAHLEEAQDFTL